MTTSYAYSYVVPKAAADIPSLSFQGTAARIVDESGRTWSWNGVSYSLGEDGNSTGAQDSLDPPSSTIPPSARAVAAAVAPLTQAQATIAQQAITIASLTSTVTAMQAAISALQAAVLPSGSGALTLTAPTITGSGPPFAVGSTITFVSGTVGGGTAVNTTWTLKSAGNVIVQQAGTTYVIPASIGGTSITVTQSVTNAAGQVTQTTSTTYAVSAAPAVPVVITAPTITGQAAVGLTLTGNHGTYTNSSGITFTAYAWKNGNTVLGTSQTLVITSAMAGLAIDFYETPHNTAGDGASTKSAASVVVAGGSTPANVVPPGFEATSTFAVGGTLYINPGVWTGNPDPTLDLYGILRDGIPISVSISPTNPTYVCVAADQDKTLVPTLIRRNTGSTPSVMAQGAGEYIAAGTGGVIIAPTPTSTLSAITSASFPSATAGSKGFLLTPTLAGTISKSGGLAISYTNASITSGYGVLSDDTSHTTPTITFTGGTPTASGTTTTGLLAAWGVADSGITYTVALDTAANSVKVPIECYGCVVTVTATLADGSASPVSYNVDAGSATGSQQVILSIPVTAAAATNLIVTCKQTSFYTSGAGDSHYPGIWL